MRIVHLRQTGTALLLLALLTVAGCSRVKDDWKAAQTADTVQSYQQFIREHSDSEFGSQAEARIQQLLEDADWKAAAATDTRDAYEQFVAQHADGKWAQEARVRIENFKLAAAGNPPSVTMPVAGTASPVKAPPAASMPAAAPAVKAPPAVPPPTASTPKPQTRPASKPTASGKSARVQLGAFGSSAAAQDAWNKLKTKWPKQTAGLSARFEPVKSAGKTLYRLRVTLPSRSGAEQFCATLAKQKQACLVVAE
jgi:cell division septation protein DedD